MNYCSDRYLGKGCCGKVRKGWYEGTSAAIKIIPCHKMDEDDLKRECRVYAKLKHKNVVKLLGPPVKRKHNWHIPLQLIEGCTLEDLVFPSCTLSAAEKDHIILGMCKGLRYLHKKNIVHQDLKPNNVMVEHATKRAVIIDLGLAKFINYTESRSPETSGQNKGFHKYAAPEAHAGKIRTRRSDVWSMGKVIAEVLLKEMLHWDDCTTKNIRKWLKRSRYADIVPEMLHKHPDKRLSMDKVVRLVKSVKTATKIECMSTLEFISLLEVHFWDY
ncbi:hypothetical protein NDU88_010804 [Pleurodeles waltl]|uniref:Protein kinase domain-containing protein n=1 Tax=Pleurodeles waltl TaxID=8319 RepID=A0AAV7PWT5_PLEWA|nr:hypothetical protein NDU88_010804 [Pleurodeles waltl]